VSASTPMDASLDLLLRVWEAERVLDYPAIVTLAEGLPLERILENEELALVLLSAHSRLNHADEIQALLEAMRPLFPSTRRDRNYARFLFLAAENGQMHGTLVESDRLAHEGLEHAHSLDDVRLAFWGLMVLGVNAGIRGDFQQLLLHLNRALASYTRGSERWLPVLHHNIAIGYRDMGFIAEAERHFEIAARYPRPAWMEGITDMERALLLQMTGDMAAAAELARRAREAFERLGWSPGLADARMILGRVAAGAGRLDEAEAHLQAAADLVPRGHALLEAQVNEEFAALALLRGDAAAREAAEARATELYRATEATQRLERMRRRLASLAADPSGEDPFGGEGEPGG
jgi:ATP/maltotriose-dependent transcriptional regulator MalT